MSAERPPNVRAPNEEAAADKLHSFDMSLYLDDLIQEVADDHKDDDDDGGSSGGGCGQKAERPENVDPPKVSEYGDIQFELKDVVVDADGCGQQVADLGGDDQKADNRNEQSELKDIDPLNSDEKVDEQQSICDDELKDELKDVQQKMVDSVDEQKADELKDNQQTEEDVQMVEDYVEEPKADNDQQVDWHDERTTDYDCILCEQKSGEPVASEPQIVANIGDDRRKDVELMDTDGGGDDEQKADELKDNQLKEKDEEDKVQKVGDNFEGPKADDRIAVDNDDERTTDYDCLWCDEQKDVDVGQKSEEVPVDTEPQIAANNGQKDAELMDTDGGGDEEQNADDQMVKDYDERTTDYDCLWCEQKDVDVQTVEKVPVITETQMIVSDIGNEQPKDVDDQLNAEEKVNEQQSINDDLKNVEQNADDQQKVLVDNVEDERTTDYDCILCEQKSVVDDDQLMVEVVAGNEEQKADDKQKIVDDDEERTTDYDCLWCGDGDEGQKAEPEEDKELQMMVVVAESRNEQMEDDQLKAEVCDDDDFKNVEPMDISDSDDDEPNIVDNDDEQPESPSNVDQKADDVAYDFKEIDSQKADYDYEQYELWIYNEGLKYQQLKDEALKADLDGYEQYGQIDFEELEDFGMEDISGESKNVDDPLEADRQKVVDCRDDDEQYEPKDVDQLKAEYEQYKQMYCDGQLGEDRLKADNEQKVAVDCDDGHTTDYDCILCEQKEVDQQMAENGDEQMVEDSVDGQQQCESPNFEQKVDDQLLAERSYEQKTDNQNVMDNDDERTTDYDCLWCDEQKAEDGPEDTESKMVTDIGKEPKDVNQQKVEEEPVDNEQLEIAGDSCGNGKYEQKTFDQLMAECGAVQRSYIEGLKADDQQKTDDQKVEDNSEDERTITDYGCILCDDIEGLKAEEVSEDKEPPMTTSRDSQYELKEVDQLIVEVSDEQKVEDNFDEPTADGQMADIDRGDEQQQHEPKEVLQQKDTIFDERLEQKADDEQKLVVDSVDDERTTDYDCILCEQKDVDGQKAEVGDLQMDGEAEDNQQPMVYSRNESSANVELKAEEQSQSPVTSSFSPPILSLHSSLTDSPPPQEVPSSPTVTTEATEAITDTEQPQRTLKRKRNSGHELITDSTKKHRTIASVLDDDNDDKLKDEKSEDDQQLKFEEEHFEQMADNGQNYDDELVLKADGEQQKADNQKVKNDDERTTDYDCLWCEQKDVDQQMAEVGDEQDELKNVELMDIDTSGYEQKMAGHDGQQKADDQNLDERLADYDCLWCEQKDVDEQIAEEEVPKDTKVDQQKTEGINVDENLGQKVEVVDEQKVEDSDDGRTTDYDCILCEQKDVDHQMAEEVPPPMDTKVDHQKAEGNNVDEQLEQSIHDELKVDYQQKENEEEVQKVDDQLMAKVGIEQDDLKDVQLMDTNSCDDQKVEDNNEDKRTTDYECILCGDDDQKADCGRNEELELKADGKQKADDYEPKDVEPIATDEPANVELKTDDQKVVNDERTTDYDCILCNDDNGQKAEDGPPPEDTMELQMENSNESTKVELVVDEQIADICNEPSLNVELKADASELLKKDDNDELMAEEPVDNELQTVVLDSRNEPTKVDVQKADGCEQQEAEDVQLMADRCDEVCEPVKVELKAEELMAEGQQDQQNADEPAVDDSAGECEPVNVELKADRLEAESGGTEQNDEDQQKAEAYEQYEQRIYSELFDILQKADVQMSYNDDESTTADDEQSELTEESSAGGSEQQLEQKAEEQMMVDTCNDQSESKAAELILKEDDDKPKADELYEQISDDELKDDDDDEVVDQPENVYDGQKMAEEEEEVQKVEDNNSDQWQSANFVLKADEEVYGSEQYEQISDDELKDEELDNEVQLKDIACNEPTNVELKTEEQSQPPVTSASSLEAPIVSLHSSLADSSPPEDESSIPTVTTVSTEAISETITDTELTTDSRDEQKADDKIAEDNHDADERTTEYDCILCDDVEGQKSEDGPPVDKEPQMVVATCSNEQQDELKDVEQLTKWLICCDEQMDKYQPVDDELLMADTCNEPTNVELKADGQLTVDTTCNEGSSEVELKADNEDEPSSNVELKADNQKVGDNIEDDQRTTEYDCILCDDVGQKAEDVPENMKPHGQMDMDGNEPSSNVEAEEQSQPPITSSIAPLIVSLHRSLSDSQSSSQEVPSSPTVTSVSTETISEATITDDTEQQSQQTLKRKRKSGGHEWTTETTTTTTTKKHRTRFSVFQEAAEVVATVAAYVDVIPPEVINVESKETKEPAPEMRDFACQVHLCCSEKKEEEKALTTGDTLEASLTTTSTLSVTTTEDATTVTTETTIAATQQHPRPEKRKRSHKSWSSYKKPRKSSGLEASSVAVAAAAAEEEVEPPPAEVVAAAPPKAPPRRVVKTGPKRYRCLWSGCPFATLYKTSATRHVAAIHKVTEDVMTYVADTGVKR